MADRVFYTNSPSDGQIIEFDADTLTQTTIAFAAATYNFRLFYAPWCMSIDQHRLYFIESNGNIGGKVRVGYLTNCGGFQRVDLFELDNTPFGGEVVTGYKNEDDTRFYLIGPGTQLSTYDETGALLDTNTSFFDSDYQFQGGYLGQSELSIKAISEGSGAGQPDFAFGMVGDVTALSMGVGPTWDTDLGASAASRSALPGAAVRLSDHHGWLIHQEVGVDPNALIRIFEVYEDTLISVAVATFDFALHAFASPGLGGTSTDFARLYAIALEAGTGVQHICVANVGGGFTSIATTGVSPVHLIVGDEHFDDCSSPITDDEIYNVTLIGAT